MPGNALMKKVRYVFRHEGSFGCINAQERFTMVGEAEEVIGEIAKHDVGRVCELGNIIGETNLLKLVRCIRRTRYH
jgi:hypothetical protein